MSSTASRHSALHRAGFICVAVGFVVLFAWLAILFTGRYPRGLFDSTS